ncbi:MAG: hypothetical protein J0H29_21255 [Sphingobacteriales bacterium]|nr:hypothetical protein [Sphingobacteriales bacterium]OJY85106.1 MAG: hypothetical protein BGP14_04490 [Sphingobacteriales bacterium 44-15]
MKQLRTIFAFLLLAQAASAQSDSGYLDIGRLQLRKEFTQVTTIKAADIARMPFLSLSEVIRSWANGALTQKDQMVYVVDGITVADIDAYNIQDIEDITIIRNALVNQNGAGNLQLLALVRTKQWKEGSRHITFSAQGAALYRKVVTKISSHDQQTENVFSGNFQQYALTARGGNERISYGGSVGFIHDALPRRNSKDSLYDKKIPGIDRVKLNLWGRFAINKNNVLSAYLNYVPQTERSQGYEIQDDRNIDDLQKNKQYLINPYISLETRASDFLNKFTFSYTNGRALDSTLRRTEYYNGNIRNARVKDSLRAESIIFSDNLSFIKKAGNWQIEPSLNISFQKAFYKVTSAMSDAYEQSPLYGSYSWSMQRETGKLLTATPSVTLSYASLFLLQGGILLDGSKIIDSMYRNTRSYPFVNGTVNVAKLLSPEAHFGWKIFGSYSERFSGYDGVYQLNDFNHSPVLPQGLQPSIYVIGFPSAITPANKIATQWQTGSNLSFLEEKIRINYNYLNTEQIQLIAIAVFPGTGMGYRIISGEYLRKQHHFSIDADILHTDNLKWNSGLFVNIVKNDSRYDNIPSPDLLVYTEQPSTGGLINRVQYKNFYAGVDMVFLLNHEERSMSMGQVLVEKYNTLQLANLFLAYGFNTRRLDGELFLSSRNLIDSATYPVSPDNKKYFGGGIKVAL